MNSVPGDLVYGKVRAILVENGSPVFQANIERCYLCSSPELILPDSENMQERPCVDHTQMNCLLKILVRSHEFALAS